MRWLERIFTKICKRRIQRISFLHSLHIIFDTFQIFIRTLRIYISFFLSFFFPDLFFLSSSSSPSYLFHLFFFSYLPIQAFLSELHFSLPFHLSLSLSLSLLILIFCLLFSFIPHFVSALKYTPLSPGHSLYLPAFLSLPLHPLSFTLYLSRYFLSLIYTFSDFVSRLKYTLHSFSSFLSLSLSLSLLI